MPKNVKTWSNRKRKKEEGRSDADLLDDARHDRSRHLHNFDGGRLNMHNDNVTNNNGDEYDFPLEDGHCESDEHVPSISKFLDGSRFLSSESLLQNKGDTIVPLATEIGIMVAAGMSQRGGAWYGKVSIGGFFRNK